MKKTAPNESGYTTGETALCSPLSVLRMRPDDEYANNCLRLIEDTMQPKNQIKPVLASKSKKYSGPSDAPISPIEDRPVSADKLLTAAYFVDLKHKQDCSHGMSLIQLAQEKVIARNPKGKVSFSLTDLVKEGLLTSAPVCPKGGFYSWNNNEVVYYKHGGITALDAEETNV